MHRKESTAKRVKLNRKCKSNGLDAWLIRSTAPKVDETDIPEVDAGPLKMTDLNTNCLFEVMEYLKLVDLCTMAEVCVHLNKTAQKWFTIKYGKNILLNYTFILPETRRLFQIFGHLIRSLTIDFNGLSKSRLKNLFELIREYCDLKTIKKLEFLNLPKHNMDLIYYSVIDDHYLMWNYIVEVFETNETVKKVFRNRQFLLKQTN